MSDGEASLDRVVGRIEAGLAGLAKQLEDHTDMDNRNFQALSQKIDALDVSAKVRSVAWKWAAGVAATVVAAAQAAQSLGWLP